ncbi:beta-glucosidase [Granulicella aggregans]|uniref:Beta-glucosidase n=1 Tax=Granulicella aggregans TaxID=474949 RepID=A0A7W7Z957_9BACT|nr:glycoside hydrolase family 3 C-terminal domain-containing protein [Granulicella aggregans]MBB5055611.1 beta-glucosidase [Granulicella aggregans]
MDKSLSPDQRADLLLRQLTLDQKLQLMHGTGDPHEGPVDPHASESNGGSGFVIGLPEIGLPGIQIDDSAYGVAYSAGSGRYSTALPCNLASAATWDPLAAQKYGQMIGQELRDQGYNMTLGGGVNLAREPRDARTFEYLGEDPLLAGTMVGNLIQGVQSTHVIGDIKHFAMNDQESGRHAVSSNIGERAMRETDLLAFQLGIEIGHPGAVMCSYNRVNETYACENEFLLKTVLKGDWKFPGFVISDWLATHSTVQSSHAGLDNEEPENTFYGPAMKQAVESGKVPLAEVDDHVHRILRTMFAAGVVDDPPKKQVPDVFVHAQLAREIEQKSIVLLENRDHLLPLDAGHIHTIAVIGRNADRGMISGGGSAQVDPPGGNAIGDIPEAERKADWQRAIWFPDAPLAAIKATAPGVRVTFNDGSDPAAAAAAAEGADAVLFFAYQWMAEGVDLPTLGLPDGQDAVIAAVTQANPHTVVVLETGGPVLMPWVKDVSSIVESWYSGSMGATAIADVLFGASNPSGKLPITFPLADADLPHPKLITPPPASQEDWTDSDKMSLKLLQGLPSFDVTYDEGLKVGYKWYDAEHKPVLFPFGFGLSYSTFAYTNLSVTTGSALSVSVTVKNTGTRAGDETAQIYAAMPASTGEPPQRLIGWVKASLLPGEEKRLSVEIPLERLAVWNESGHRFSVDPGTYTITAGPDSRDQPLHQSINRP